MSNAIPSREPEAGRAALMRAAGISLLLHGAALACFYWFGDVTPPEPVKVIAVEFVHAADIAGSLGRPATDQSSSSRALERTKSDVVPAATGQHQPVLRRREDETPTMAKARSDATATEMERATELELGAAPRLGHEPSLREPILPEAADRPLVAERSVGPLSLTSEAALPPPIPRAKPARPDRPIASIRTEIALRDEPERLKDVTHKPVEQWAPRNRVDNDAGRVADQTRQPAKPDARADQALAVVPAAGRSRMHEGTGNGLAAPPRFGGARLSNPPPRYPYLARRRGQEGRVILRVRVSAAGHAEAVLIRQSSGYRILDKAAVKAVRKWRFAPALKGGGSVAGSVDVPVSFKLTD